MTFITTINCIGGHGFEGIFEFLGISTENLSLSFTTSWTDAGGAKLGKNISSIINGKVFKAFARSK